MFLIISEIYLFLFRTHVILIDCWKAEKCFKGFIDYDKLESYREFTELRNEEDYLITEDGARFWGTKVLLLQNDDI